MIGQALNDAERRATLDARFLLKLSESSLAENGRYVELDSESQATSEQLIEDVSMIVSHKYRFIFIKTLKTAGTSIEVYLSQYCGPDDILTPILPHVEPHQPRNDEGFFNHMPAHEVRERVGHSVWNSYFKFCVERNPWDKVLSYYHMMNHRQGGTLDFDEFLRGSDFPINYPTYTEPDDSSRILVDRVLRYESLSADLAVTFKQLGIPFAGSLGVNAKSEYRSDRRPYCEVYTRSQADRVGKIFAVERTLHGYEF